MTIDTGNDEATYTLAGTPLVQLDAPQISGVMAVLQDCAHVITTPKGALFYDTTIGVPTPAQTLMNADLSDTDLLRVGREWSIACQAQVDGCAAAQFTLRRQADGKSIRFFGSIRPDGSGSTFPLLGTAAQVVSIIVPPQVTT